MASASGMRNAVGPSDLPRPFFIPIISLAVLTFTLFADVLLSSRDLVLSHSTTDLYLQFIHWRDFGFEELRNGNLALWNPHIFAGMPYFGGFQSALLYPPNWLHLILPLADAINFGIALHVFLAGLFMYLWASSRGLHVSAALLSAILFMFCGAHFLHIYAGHLANLCVIAWIPLLFLSLDRLFFRFSPVWVLVGVLSVTMQVLAGHPQYVFYTAIAVAFYTAFWTYRTRRLVRSVGALGAIYLGAAALAAVQILAGWDAAAEGVRSEGISYEMAAMISFPPENLLTAFIPGLYGDLTSFPYWGRWYLWETSLFLGVSGIFLAAYGTIWGESKARSFSITMVAILFVLALGSYTPLFPVLFFGVPGFYQFGCNSKFILQVSLFLAMLAGIGFDALLRGPQAHRRVLQVLLTASVLVGLLGLWVYQQSGAETGGWWGTLLERVLDSRQTYLSPALYEDAGFRRGAALFASQSLLLAAATGLLIGCFIYLGRKRKQALYLIGLLAVVEMTIFAASNRPTFDLQVARFPELERYLEDQPADDRIMFEVIHNLAMSIRAHDLWGYDPGVLRRYAEFMAFTQGHPPDQASQYLEFDHYHPLYRMLRCRNFFTREKDRIRIETFPDLMSRLQLLSEYEVIAGRDEILAAMNSPDFDPRRKAILEERPVPGPERSGQTGSARIAESSTDHLIIEAEVPAPTLLLITDNYSSGWRAAPFEPSMQSEYTILRANYTLQAIPLSAGRHRLKVEFLPRAFQVGKWISVVSVVVYAVALVFTIVYKKREQSGDQM